MVRYVLGRFLRGSVVVVVATFLATMLLRLVPGSVAYAILGDTATPQAVTEFETRLGLDRPLFAQYAQWGLGLLRGDLGDSLLSGQPILGTLLSRLPVTLELTLLALLLALALAVPVAMVAAAHPGGVVDRVSSAASSAALSVPAFVAGPVLVYLFAVKAGLFPATGWVPVDRDLGRNLRSALLPAIAIALPEAAAFQRLLRSDLAGTLREDYIEAARSKGLGRGYVLWRHALRPSAFSLMTLAGISLGRLLGGAIVVETLFALPGIGQLMVQSITARDIATVQGVVAFVVIAYVLINTTVDVTYGLVDPRVRRVSVR
ncbi:ABC transporter permease [Pseudonocardia sp.]|uniref:ABC transporter permease n=1 Tax=Pseudonocardia sp. TaxID=60912 RepID=UPI003D124B70